MSHSSVPPYSPPGECTLGLRVLHVKGVVLVLERVAQLCASLGSDPGLRAMLIDHGVTEAHWETLLTAVRDGVDPPALTRVLDAVEQAAAAAGIDGLTTADRRYERLPDAGPGPRTVHGWSQCPHSHPCGRVHHADGGTPAVCSLSGVALTPVTVISG